MANKRYTSNEGFSQTVKDLTMNKLQRQQLKRKDNDAWYGFVQDKPKKKPDISYRMKIEREKLKLETERGWK
jgi:hypothetical protein